MVLFNCYQIFIEYNLWKTCLTLQIIITLYINYSQMGSDESKPQPKQAAPALPKDTTEAKVEQQIKL